MALRLVCEALIVVGRRDLVWLSDRDPDSLQDLPTVWNKGNVENEHRLLGFSWHIASVWLIVFKEALDIVHQILKRV